MSQVKIFITVSFSPDRSLRSIYKRLFQHIIPYAHISETHIPKQHTQCENYRYCLLRSMLGISLVSRIC